MINYYLLTKPGIIMGNLLPLAAGFLLASKGKIDFLLFFQTLLGLAFVMASACVFNNYIDRHIDEKMQRTKGRALVVGTISHVNALCFGSLLGFVGAGILFFATNLLTLGIAVIGFIVYVVLYSMWKCHTIFGTAIGSVAGAVPPVVGYCAVSNQFDLGALILFVILVLWQMPHFFAIAIYRLEEYAAAGLPLLPIEKSVFRTKIHMVFYIAAFIISASLLTFYNYTGYLYLMAATIGGLVWLGGAIRGFNSCDDAQWGRSMFQLSLLLITAICIAIPLDIVI